MGFPIRRSWDQSLFSTPPSLSQSITSFIASYCQGIHQTPFSRLIRSRRRMKHSSSNFEKILFYTYPNDRLIRWVVNAANPSHDELTAVSVKTWKDIYVCTYHSLRGGIPSKVIFTVLLQKKRHSDRTHNPHADCAISVVTLFSIRCQSAT